MKILVTGAAGFIGFHTAAKLLQRGDEVVGLDNFNDYYDVDLKNSRARVMAITLPNLGASFVQSSGLSSCASAAVGIKLSTSQFTIDSSARYRTRYSNPGLWPTNSTRFHSREQWAMTSSSTSRFAS